MKSIDYGWVVVIVIGVLLFFIWKPMMGLFGGMSDNLSNKEGYDRGKIVFYDADIWGGKGSNKSCALCHATDGVVDTSAKVEMIAYREGEPYPLKDINKKYFGGVMDTGDRLYEQIMLCLTGPDRMALGRVSMTSTIMQDLMLYVQRQ